VLHLTTKLALWILVHFAILIIWQIVISQTQQTAVSLKTQLNVSMCFKDSVLQLMDINAHKNKKHLA
jgi:hypothetical protein